MKNRNTISITKHLVKTACAVVFGASVVLAPALQAVAGNRVQGPVTQDIESQILLSFNDQDDQMANAGKRVQGQSTKVNINLANFEQLVALPGIGKVKANAILRYREEVGRFETLEDLQNIKGIGAKLYAKLQGKIEI